MSQISITQVKPSRKLDIKNSLYLGKEIILYLKYFNCKSKNEINKTIPTIPISDAIFEYKFFGSAVFVIISPTTSSKEEYCTGIF